MVRPFPPLISTRPNQQQQQAKHHSLSDITHQLVSIIASRAKEGKHYGVILLPEGLIEAVPEFQVRNKVLFVCGCGWVVGCMYVCIYICILIEAVPKFQVRGFIFYGTFVCMHIGVF